MPNWIGLTRTLVNSIAFYEVHRPQCTVPFLMDGHSCSRNFVSNPIFRESMFENSYAQSEKKGINELGQSPEMELLS